MLLLLEMNSGSTSKLLLLLGFISKFSASPSVMELLLAGIELFHLNSSVTSSEQSECAGPLVGLYVPSEKEFSVILISL